jgi:hypothetical protein
MIRNTKLHMDIHGSTKQGNSINILIPISFVADFLLFRNKATYVTLKAMVREPGFH